MFEKYLINRNKGKIDNEVFYLYLDSLCGENCYKSKTSLFIRRIHNIKNKRQLIDWHIERIEKFSKKVDFTPEQKDFISEIINYKNQEKIDYYDFRAFIKENKGIIKTSVLYSIRVANINLLEWLVIMVIAIIAILLQNI